MTKKHHPSGLEDYYFELPRDLIAQRPPEKRGGSRLMIVYADLGRIETGVFASLSSRLPERSLLVFNDARVTPARLLGSVGGAKGEVLILEPVFSPDEPGCFALWCLARPARKFSLGERFLVEKDGRELKAEVLELGEGGKRLLSFDFTEKPSASLALLGHIPLPPYIRRPDDQADLDRYQTVYAGREGAVASPTAGLHFTESHLRELRELGQEFVKIHLRVGAGTFQPLTEESLARGKLHEERVEIDGEAAERINRALSDGRLVLSVGTTTLRALEWGAEGGALEAKSGYTDIFIRPGHVFRTAGALLTNFHLPCSSLFMLTSAFAGLSFLKEAYRRAVEEGFRFYSYGDAMLIIRGEGEMLKEGRASE
ncbi:MAG: tRNA preQ1(34) S-adenosylmethionine ribosyltransferase-isomerase QueA [Deltaproteobacteria bacterium]|nr:tRNA preQ1(34) S-adenosylmethionine ribosyltransferase-isomerase QueA [Deltaproteobacteria bacterium]